MSSRLALVWLTLAGITLGLLLRPATASPGATERVSVDLNGNEANGRSLYPAISGDGRYIAFISDASNLVTGDTNGFEDVFVRDRQTQQTRRVSVSSESEQGDSFTLGGYIPHLEVTKEGRLIAFTSQARNLVPDDTNLRLDVFIHNIETAQTSRVSVGEDGRQLSGSSELVDMSPDGRYITFFNEQSGLMMRDVVAGKTETNVTSEHDFFSESHDGRYLAVLSLASDLVPNDTNGTYDIFVHDRATNVIKSPTVGIQPRGFGPILQAPVISGNGRHVVFSLGLSETSVFDTTFRLFVYDAVSDTTEMLLTAESGRNGDTLSQHSISSDGRYIAFSSSDPNLVSGDTNGASDIFIYDRGPQPEAPSPPPFEAPTPSPSPEPSRKPTTAPVADPCGSSTPTSSPSPEATHPAEVSADPSSIPSAAAPVDASPYPPSPQASEQPLKPSPTGSVGLTTSPEPTSCADALPENEIAAEEEVSLNIGWLAGVSAAAAGTAIGLTALALTWRARRRL